MTNERGPSNYDIGVIGLGETGVSVVHFLREQGVSFFLADSRADPPGLRALGLGEGETEMVLGSFERASLARAETLVVSPGINTNVPPFSELRDAGTEVIGDIELFARYANAPVIAITGSNGKSTVVSLLDHLFAASELEVATGGNLGTPALSLIREPAPDFYLLELSSFQLETTYSLDPSIACILNIAADHMDRYDSFADYVQAKQRILTHASTIVRDIECRWSAKRDRRNVVNFSTQYVLQSGFGVDLGSRCITYQGEPFIDVAEVPLAGSHNLGNVVAALAIGLEAGMTLDTMQGALQSFSGLPHRCQLVSTIDGVTYVDDSKGTNVAATVAAINGLGEKRNLILIAGGVGKGADFEPLGVASEGKVRHAILIGEAQSAIGQVLANRVEYEIVDALDEAVAHAQAVAQPGDTVLLSPACASFDMFKNFEERGHAFQTAVTSLRSRSQQ